MHRRAFITTAAAGFSGLSLAADLSISGLEAVRDNLARRNTKAFLVIKDGRLICEWYAEGVNASSKHGTASMAKALVGGMSLLVASSDGRIKPYDKAAKFIPAWKSDPLKSKILIRHLATHTSGIEDSSVEGVKHNEEPGWKGAFWRKEPDPFSVAVREAPVLFEPGTGNQYSNPGMAALSYAVTASLVGTPQTDILSLLRERIMRPIGLTDKEWSIGYGRAYEVDGLKLYANWGGGAFTPRATARIAELLMREGQWDGKEIIPRRFVKQALHYAGMPLPDRKKEPHAPGSGLGFYTNFDGVWPSVPRDAFAGAGAGHQVFLAVPSLNLIVVRNGGQLAKDEFWTCVYEHLFNPVMRALGNPASPGNLPYPQSTVIRSVSFAPEASVIRKAIDSDNWPLTWADDGEIYTSYGDGFGFEPRVSEKLSMGFAKVQGGPDDFRGVNVRSKSGERVGDGPKGAKASGLVMVDGTLFMWVRNVQNSQLVSSKDHGRTWEWGFKLERGFGSPAFLNFGRNYAGARDEFVYAYSQAGSSAYEVDDGVLLARAPKSKILDRSAWQFHSGKGWAEAIEAAQPVFRFPKHCQRVDAVYHPASKRYLLVVGYGHDGGWGIFDAPEPWGPWSVAFHTEYWGLGETHGYRIPSKWISEDGRSLALVFSGLIYNGVSYDAFCVRKMIFEF